MVIYMIFLNTLTEKNTMQQCTYDIYVENPGKIIDKLAKHFTELIKIN